MAFCDFVVKYNPDVDTQTELIRKIWYSIFIKRIKSKKPVVIFIGGDSGEGKSSTGITVEYELLRLQGIDLRTCLHDVNIYEPLEYPTKMDKLLNSKELKKVNIVCIHEARTVVKANQWHSFLNQSISDINAMQRTVKRMITIIISQFIRDIDKTVRYTLNFYCMVRRPKNKHARLYINVLWKDDRDLENPKLRKRKLSGYLVLPNGKYKRYVPQYFELKEPDKDIIEEFEKKDFESKATIIKEKLKKLLKEMSEDRGEVSNKINLMVEWYLKHSDSLSLIGKRFKGKFKLKPNIKEMHELTELEVNEFQKKLNEKLKEVGQVNEIEEDLEA